MKVIAMSKGQYQGVMHCLGDVFEIDDAKDKAPWMKETKISTLAPGPAPLPKPAKTKGESHV